MQLELTYELPFDRLWKASQSAARRIRLPAWLPVLLLFAGILVLQVFSDALELWMQSAGFPAGRFAVDWLLFAGAVACWILMYRLLRSNPARLSMDGGLTTRLTTDDGGLRFDADGLDTYLKWQGISQILVEADGVVVSCGMLIFFVPDAAFPDAGMRRAFIRGVYGHLTEMARSRSEKYIRPVLDSGS